MEAGPVAELNPAVFLVLAVVASFMLLAIRNYEIVEFRFLVGKPERSWDVPVR